MKDLRDERGLVTVAAILDSDLSEDLKNFVKDFDGSYIVGLTQENKVVVIEPSEHNIKLLTRTVDAHVSWYPPVGLNREKELEDFADNLLGSQRNLTEEEQECLNSFTWEELTK